MAKKIFGKYLIHWLNLLLLQWFFIRLWRNDNWTQFGVFVFLLPLAGWRKRYRVLGRKIYIIKFST